MKQCIKYFNDEGKPEPQFRIICDCCGEVYEDSDGYSVWKDLPNVDCYLGDKEHVGVRDDIEDMGWHKGDFSFDPLLDGMDFCPKCASYDDENDTLKLHPQPRVDGRTAFVTAECVEALAQMMKCLRCWKGYGWDNAERICGNTCRFEEHMANFRRLFGDIADGRTLVQDKDGKTEDHAAWLKRVATGFDHTLFKMHNELIHRIRGDE